MDRQKFAFDKTNFILLAIGMAVIIVGFLLMTGPSSTEGYFEPDIFSVRRIKVAPAVCFFGFIFMIYGIVRKPKDSDEVEPILFILQSVSAPCGKPDTSRPMASIR